MRTEMEGERDVERIRGGLIGILPEDARVIIQRAFTKDLIVLHENY